MLAASGRCIKHRSQRDNKPSIRSKHNDVKASGLLGAHLKKCAPSKTFD